MKNINRRNFVKSTSVGSIGAAALGFSNLSFSQEGKHPDDNVFEKPREVWIAAMAKNDIEGKNFKETIDAALREMENAVAYKPDIYCLPETFLDPAQKS